jgi:hypothetical protein
VSRCDPHLGLIVQYLDVDAAAIALRTERIQRQYLGDDKRVDRDERSVRRMGWQACPAREMPPRSVDPAQHRARSVCKSSPIHQEDRVLL